MNKLMVSFPMAWSSIWLHGLGVFIENFSHEWMLNFSKTLSFVYWGDHADFIILSLNMYHTDWFIVNKACIPGITLIWSWHIIFFMCCWISGVLQVYSSAILACRFIFLWFLVWPWYQDDSDLTEWV